MARRDVERLRNYLALITQKQGGIEAAIETAASSRERPLAASVSTLEGIETPIDPAAAAQRAVEAFADNREPSDAEAAGLEAIIAADIRPAIDIVNGKFTVTHPLWKQISDDAAIRGRIEAVIPSIGRLDLIGDPSCPYGGTGFVVGDGLIMTNRHVAALFTNGLGDRNLVFISNRGAEIDFLHEQGRSERSALSVRRVVMIHPYWDMALLAVDGLATDHRPLPLSLDDARDLAGRDICIIGYPAFDPRNAIAEQQDLFRGTYGVKRLQPGELHEGLKTSSFGKEVAAATHDCSTLGGNSGSAVIDLATGHVLALHFGGLYHQQNYAVPSAALARDQRIIDRGVVFAATPPGGGHEADDWWRRADATEAAASSDTASASTSTSAPAASGGACSGGPTSPPSPAAPVVVTSNEGAVHIEIPLRITISLGSPTQENGDRATAGREAVVGAAAPPLADVLEALREPDHDPDYAGRRGYDPDFLAGAGPTGAGLTVVLPTAADPGVCAPTRSGGSRLDYQNFSILVHASRRLALVCASNVTREPALRQPEPGRDYSRRGLTGLGPNDQERWFFDPRLDSRFQLPDVFFTRDRGAFDKGHIVRRDDVAWGASYELLRRANGDTFHVTNCSPQVAGFNRSNAGIDNWGDLENHVLSEAANERLCVFAAPVLDARDETFLGVGEDRALLRVKIPQRYWKVIVARVDDGLAAFGFVLEQDLANVDLEFAVPPEFVATMRPLTDIEAMTGIVFPAAVRNADQFATTRGGEIGRRTGTRRPTAPRH